MSANLEDPVVVTGLEKVNPYSNPKKGSTEECSNHQTIALIPHASKVMLKILHPRLHHYMNQELQMSMLGLEKEEEPELKLPTSVGSSKK